ncbi:MAG: diguanylate cyclase [Pseudomonadota bacterium]
MEHIYSDSWPLIYVGLIFMLTCAFMLVVYVLSDSSNPPAGLGFYTVYFMAALLGWIAFALKQVADIPMPVDVPSVAAVVNSYILFIASGQRAGTHWGLVLFGLVCLAACLSVFFVSAEHMFIIQNAISGVFFAAVGANCILRAWQRSNVGDAISTAACLVMVIGVPFALYQALVTGDTEAAQSIGFASHSAAYVLVATGFLASVLIEYQGHLSQLATEDPLTRLLNRRGLETALQVTLAQAARQQTQTAAIMVDIDRFKEINDNFGHEIGDQVIRRVAECLTQMSRASDVVARTGGEEYLLILPNTDLESAKILAERIRTAVAERIMVFDQQRVPVTVSLGVASAAGEVVLDQLSQEADRAMYLAKRGGTNRVASVENKRIRLTTSSKSA